ncbi:MAG: acyl-CoA dehydrogenase family protein [Anaerolineae bacterium]|nr:acyl-CoA dehydrogenase family protein [Anaerolineae bacterium]
MDLTLSEEQLMFKKMFADFCTKEIRPKGEHIDQTEEPPEDLLAKAVDQGFWAALVPQELEGCGMDTYTFTLMLEELARADMSTALILHVHNCLVVKPLLEYGSDEQKGKYLEALAFGEKLGAFALTEASAGSDEAAIKMTAARNGSGYVLNGAKNWVSNGSLAGLFLVFAKAEGGITAFLIELEADGVKVGYREKTLGLRGVPANTVYFDNVHVPEANRLGAEGEGMEIAQRALSLGRLALAAIALGGAERALEEAVQFSIEHIQFGGPIALKQIIQSYVADAKTQTEALRSLVLHTAWLADSGQDYAQEASIAKLFGSRTAYEVTNKMVQVHGGYGYMKDYAIERYYRDCRALEIIEGPSQIQQFLIACDIYKAKGLEIKP